MFLVVTRSTERSAVLHIIAQLRESIRMFDVMSDRRLCLSSVPRALLAKVTGAAEDLFPPCLVLRLMIVDIQDNHPPLARNTAIPTSQDALFTGIAAPLSR